MFFEHTFVCNYIFVYNDVLIIHEQTGCRQSLHALFGAFTVRQRSHVPQESHRDELFTVARTEKERNNGKAFEREKGGGVENKNSMVFRERLRRWQFVTS